MKDKMMKLDSISNDLLLKYSSECITFNELSTKLGYSGKVNTRVRDKIIDLYNKLGINIKEKLQKNYISSKQKVYTCKQCGKTFTEKYSKWSNGDFCCKHCAKVYASTYNKAETNKKVSASLEGRSVGGKTNYNLSVKELKDRYYNQPKICELCGNIIPYERRFRHTCCVDHGNQLRIKNHPHCGGGYRIGSSRTKHGWYKRIWCDSTYELAYVIYCLDHNIPIKRCEEVFEYQLDGVTHQYHPDFVVNENEIVEIKGYDRGDVEIKRTSVGNREYKLLYRCDLIPMFEYVSKTYNKKYNKGKNNFYELYDE